MSEREALLARIPERLLHLTDKVATRRLAICLGVLDRRVNGVAVVAEAVHRRHNVSAVIRSAEAFGVHEVHMVTEHFKPSVGAAKGAERWVERVLHESTASCLAGLKSRGFHVYVADLSDDAVTPDDVPVDQPLAVLFGSELDGVSPVARELADGVITIPMVGVTRSLNVSVAAAVTMYTICQRRRAVPGAVGIRGAQAEALLEHFLSRENARKRAEGVIWRQGERLVPDPD